MDVFGAVWARHADRMAVSWDERVAQDDVVLLPGDLSWARNLEEASPDLAWIGARPGTKYLLRGNHDGWWDSVAKVRRALPPRCLALQNDAFDLGETVLVGGRGWVAPDDPLSGPNDPAIFQRELGRLRLSIEDADRKFGREKHRIAMLHFPPWIEGRDPGDVVAALKAGGVRTCVYGHLHGADHALAMTGDHDGIRYRLVAADAIDFAPALLD